jgi:hypothetical protein
MEIEHNITGSKPLCGLAIGVPFRFSDAPNLFYMRVNPNHFKINVDSNYSLCINLETATLFQFRSSILVESFPDSILTIRN